MKTSELRLGNWIVEDETIYSGGMRKITRQIEASDFAMIDDDHSSDHWDMITPIPLTEEWLVRFGFRKSDKYGYFLSPHEDSCSDSCFTRLCFSLEEMDFIVNSNDYDGWYVHCEHIHQLQNLYFALTDCELRIDGDD